MKRACQNAGFGLLLALFAAGGARGETSALWTDVSASEVDQAVAGGERRIVPDRAHISRLDSGALAALLATMPAETDAPQGLAGTELTLTDPNGASRTYRVVNSPIMEAGLAAKYPDWRTFRLIDTIDARYGGRGDWTAHGFHAMVRTSAGSLFVDPLLRGDTELYQSYFRADLKRRSGEEFRCQVDDPGIDLAGELASSSTPEAPQVGLDLRIYRLALAATGEYTAFHGGTVPLAMAAIVTAVNRVDDVYETDLAIRMVLVGNNSLVVYTNPSTDPYSNNNGVAMLGENQANLDAVIHPENYDIGHVFSTGGGGVASLGVPCGSSKARGVTGLSSPVGDPFYIDYVAHEMGHQWGGSHTFNSQNSNCSGNRSGTSAYEVGSGSTIMAYAGICGSENLQTHSDAYFHRRSLDQIETYSRTGNGNSCKVLNPQGNAAPIVNAGSDYTIPISTPFLLSGSATDADGGTLDYCWEQFDLGAASPPFPPTSGNAPIFRSFSPVSVPVRTFPRVADLVNGTVTFGEALPTYTRTMHFRLTARDNQRPAGAEGFEEMLVTATDTAGPFLVTAPNSALVWSGSGPHTVSWDVAGTTAPPVSCATVDIDLSTDGGFTFEQSLATNVLNDGSTALYTGSADTTTARVRVACRGNIFFDISNADFTINGASNLIFADGFEGADSGNWSATVG